MLENSIISLDKSFKEVGVLIFPKNPGGKENVADINLYEKMVNIKFLL